MTSELPASRPCCRLRMLSGWGRRGSTSIETGPPRRTRSERSSKMTTIGIDEASNDRSLELAASEEGVYASVGIHPNSATGWDDERAARVETLLSAPDVVGVGETGLDFYRDWAPPAHQERAFV